jgi:catechol 2,3-dioxygenase-like lactoylglutathione lyase family enzyme
MHLGAFSISLAVKDIAASRTLYEKLGFSVFGGDQQQRWLIMKNGASVIGLFQGMLEKNVLTFNPGWDSEAREVPGFEDVRSIQLKLKEQGVMLDQEADGRTKGPAFIALTDPDGTPILIDQHV